MANPFRGEKRALSGTESANALAIKCRAAELWDLFDAQPASREIANAKTRLEESVMWALGGIGT